MHDHNRMNYLVFVIQKFIEVNQFRDLDLKHKKVLDDYTIS